MSQFGLNTKTVPKHKILYITPFPHIGGGETSLIYLLQKLNRKKFEPVVVVSDRGQVYDRLIKMKVRVEVMKLPPYWLRTLFVPGVSLPGIVRLFKLCNKTRPSLIHINHPTLAIYSGIVGKVLKIPVVATAHGSWDCIYFYQDLINQIFIDKVLAITDEIKFCLGRRRIISGPKIKTIYLGIDTNYFKPAFNKSKAKRKLGIEPNSTVVSMICRLDFVKNHITFLKIANEVAKDIPNTTFLVVGDTKKNLEEGNNVASKVKDQLDMYIKSHPRLKKRVLFTNFQTDMKDVYDATDILFSSSLSETLPMTFLEAASSGLPIVSFAMDSRHRIIIDGKNGYLCQQGRLDIIEKRLLKLIKNKNLRENFGKYSREYAVSHFAIDRYVKEVESIYASFWK